MRLHNLDVLAVCEKCETFALLQRNERAFAFACAGVDATAGCVLVLIDGRHLRASLSDASQYLVYESRTRMRPPDPPPRTILYFSLRQAAQKGLYTFGAAPDPDADDAAEQADAD